MVTMIITMMTIMAICHNKNNDRYCLANCRRSLRPWGVKAVVIEPGFHKTGITSPELKGARLKAAWDGASPAAKEEYGEGYLKGSKRAFHLKISVW